MLAASVLSIVDAEAKKLHFHGVVRVERSGKVLVEKGYGLSPETAFWVASISKSFTAALVARLREDGKLRGDETIGGLTIDSLLSHTSGLPAATYAAEGLDDP